MRCSAKAGACRLVGADGEPAPHFGSVAEGGRFSLIVMLRRVAGSLVPPFPLVVLVLFPGRLVMVARWRGMMRGRVWGR